MGAKNVKKNVFNIAAMLSAAFCFFLLPDMAFAGRRGMSLNERWTGTMTSEGGKVRKHESIDIPHDWDDYHGYRHLYHGNQHGSAVPVLHGQVPRAPGRVVLNDSWTTSVEYAPDLSRPFQFALLEYRSVRISNSDFKERVRRLLNFDGKCD